MVEPTPKSDDELDKGKKNQAKWFKSEKGKAAQKKYRDSDKGQAAQDRFNHSVKAQLDRSRYYYSDKGQAAHAKRADKVQTFRDMEKWLKENPDKTVLDYNALPYEKETP